MYKTKEEKRPSRATRLTVIFRLDRKEERETLDFFQTAFRVAELEMITGYLAALHISPGHPDHPLAGSESKGSEK